MIFQLHDCDYRIVKLRINKPRVHFQHLHESTDLQKSDWTRRWTKFLKTTRSYMLFESVRHGGCWLCCSKEDSEQPQSRILNIAFPDHSFFICFCVKAEQYSTESLEVYKLKKNKAKLSVLKA